MRKVCFKHVHWLTGPRDTGWRRHIDLYMMTVISGNPLAAVSLAMFCVLISTQCFPIYYHWIYFLLIPQTQISGHLPGDVEQRFGIICNGIVRVNSKGYIQVVEQRLQFGNNGHLVMGNCRRKSQGKLGKIPCVLCRVQHFLNIDLCMGNFKISGYAFYVNLQETVYGFKISFGAQCR